MKFSDDMTILSIVILNNNEADYLEEIKPFSMGCRINDLHPNTKKTKEMIDDSRKKNTTISLA